MEGYGNTENGSNGVTKLAANLTVISNDQCRDLLGLENSREPQRRNRKKLIKRKLCRHFPRGIDDKLFCARGIYRADRELFTAACQGDSGGPLKVNHLGKETIIGIVSGMSSLHDV